MIVLDILQNATLHGVAVSMADLFEMRPNRINDQLRKAIAILSTKPVGTLGRIEISYVADGPESYYDVTYVDGDDGRWCAAIMPWGEWLLQPVCVHGPVLTNDEMAALILYEMTPSGAPQGCMA